MIRTRSRARNGGSGASRVLRISAVNDRMPLVTRNFSATKVRRIQRSIKPVPYNRKTLAIGIPNFAIGTSSTISQNTNTLTIVAMSLQCPNGTSIPLYKNGSRSWTIQTTDKFIISDEVLPAAAGYSDYFPAGDYWIKFDWGVPATSNLFPSADNNLASDVANQQSLAYDPAVTFISTVDAAGVFTWTGTAPDAVGNYMLALFMIGEVYGEDLPVVLGIGDSNAEGFQDTTSKNKGGNGMFQRAAYNNGHQMFPCLNFAKSSAQYTLPNNNWEYIAAFLPYVNIVVDEMGGNDLNAGVSVATLQTRMTTMWDAIKAGGVSKIIHTELLTRTTSTDNFLTTANQTAASAVWASGGNKDQIMDWLDTKVTDGTILMVAPVGRTHAEGSSNLLWNVDGVTNNLHVVADGIHLTTYSNINGAGPAIHTAVWNAHYGISNVGMLAQFTAADYNTITESGGNVDTWRDAHLGYNTATQSTAAAKPIYSATSMNSAYAGLTADGGDYLDLATSIGYSNGVNVIAVVQPVDTAGHKYILGGTIGSPVLSVQSTEVLSFARQQQLTLASGTTVVSGAKVVQGKTTGSGAGTGTEVYINGTLDGSGAASPAFSANITRLFGADNAGLYNPFNGVISEIIITTGDVNVSGLMRKYGIA